MRLATFILIFTLFFESITLNIYVGMFTVYVDFGPILDSVNHINFMFLYFFQYVMTIYVAYWFFGVSFVDEETLRFVFSDLIQINAAAVVCWFLLTQSLCLFLLLILVRPIPKNYKNCFRKREKIITN